ncbi:CTNNA [Lepeophtheirus salmonis]|uniref:CTNNA n=1 Tax=Lepeophtheirus salmonis TaxID=72036 RepID=A0A7R8D2S0_LEPSM|nr:CTNNA [Lepeophtheirus salmonis]CAF3007967.1 CTNNA [Lepeophtheirus salmonis]
MYDGPPGARGREGLLIFMLNNNESKEVPVFACNYWRVPKSGRLMTPTSDIMGSEEGGVAFHWNPQHLEIKTRSVEKTLEPLVLQVTTLVASSKSPQKKKGKSKRAHVLVAAVEKATANFVERGRLIAKENPDIETEMLAAVEQVLQTGETMSSAAREFATDPCSSIKRGNMVRAARNLLSAVTRLLILADMIDVHLLLKKLRRVEDDLEYLKSVSSQAELMDSIKRFGESASELMNQAAKRQYELKDPALRDDLAAARAVLKKTFYDASYCLESIYVARGKSPSEWNGLGDGPGELAAALDDFDDLIITNPLIYNESRTRPCFEERLESIISGAALIADASCTRDERKDRIVAECNSVRQALQDLLSEYMSNAGKQPSANLDRAIESMQKKTRDLRRQLRKAVVDHVSDSFLDCNVPLHVMIAAAKEGNEKDVEEYARIFVDHADKLVEVSKLACSMSANEDGVKMVKYAASQIEKLCPQVVNAAKVLSARPKSKVAQENIQVFKEAWEEHVRILTDAVDDITTVDDFLAVSENHILEDVNNCVAALQSGDAGGLDRMATSIQGRSSRICNVVSAEMDNYEPGVYTERVNEAIRILRGEVMPNFAHKVESAVDMLSSPSPVTDKVDENEFIDASRLVYDGVREIRRAVLLNRSTEEDVDSDTEWEIMDERASNQPRPDSTTTEIDEYPEISGITNAREAMKKLPEEDRAKIAQQVETFKLEKSKFDQEVSKWDDKGNDIIVLAKHMCMIMMEMTDFTRGRGPLQTTMAVINAAKKISEAGTKLDKLARQIADQCPESSTKKDLTAYLQRIALHCHQLNITSKVKADAAKNLMNAVVLTVKASYVASTKYPKQAAASGLNLTPIVVWKMKVPEKKPLVRRDAPEEIRAKVRKGSQKKPSNPISALNEFMGPDEMI